jgi:hypothetical protein
VEGAPVEWDVAEDQARFFESGMPFVPRATVDRVAAWCVERLVGDGRVAVEPVAPRELWAAIAVDVGGRWPVVERPISVGASGLFGVLSEPKLDGVESAKPRSLPAVVLLNIGGDRHTGPSRLWVDLGRSWASAGVRVLRLDLDGIGDSPSRPGEERDDTYPRNGIADVVEAARFLVPDNPGQVLLSGVCSGAYHAAEAAVLLGSKVVWLFNPWIRVASSLRESDGTDGSVPTQRRRFVRRADPISRRLISNVRAVDLAQRFIPAAGWWLLDKLGIFTYPIRAFEHLADRGTEVFLVCGESEAVQFSARGHRVRRRLERSGRFHFRTVEGFDHSVLMPQSRLEVADRLGEYVLGEFAAGARE